MTDGRAEAPREPSAPNPGSLLLSGSDEFDNQALIAREVIDRARARYTMDGGLAKDLFPQGGESIVRTMYDSGLTAYLYGEIGLAEGGASAAHVTSTFEHTWQKEKPFKRLVDTAVIFHKIFTGSRQEGFDEAEAVYKMHTRVHGHFREGVGPHPAGTAYSAFDPAMMKWTGVSIANGLLGVHEALHGRSSDEQRDEFCQDFSKFPELFGLPREEFPQTYQELQDYVRETSGSGELHLTQAATYIGKQILSKLPVPGLMLPARELIVNPILRGALTEEMREMYGLRYNSIDKVRFGLAILGARAIGAVLPNSAKNDGVIHVFNSIADTEDRRVRHHKPHATVPADPYHGES